MIYYLPPRESEEEWHAITRARERYGIELSKQDILVIGRRCGAGEGRQHLGASGNGETYHSIVWGDRVLWVVFRSKAAGARYDKGVVVSIVPARTANYAVEHSMTQAKRRGVKFSNKMRRR